MPSSTSACEVHPLFSIVNVFVLHIHPTLFFSKKIPDQLIKFSICIPPVTHFIIGANPRSERVEATDPSWEKM